MDSKNIGVILLAAGSSSRMGQSKQLLPVNGEPLLLRSIRVALDASLKNIVVVLGSEEEKHRAILGSLAVESIFNKAWATGMGSSLKAGLGHLIQRHPETQAALIMVCDQPNVSAKHLIHLITSFHESNRSIVASGYSGTMGVPIIFSKDHFSEILSLNDSQGAKKIIEKNKANVLMIDFPDGSTDLDTPSDYQQYIKGQ